MSAPALSICIVNFNTQDLLAACLDSVFAQAGELEQEVIVIDNASTDGSAEMVQTRFPQVKLIRMDENVGYARANNAGMRQAGGRYILLLNSDTVVLDHALARMVSFLDEHPQYAVVGPTLLNPDGSLQTSCFAFTTVRDVLFESFGLTSLFPHSPLFNRRGLGGFDRRTVREVDWVSGACFMVRREAVELVGPLDEGFFMYGEELDWCYRMHQAGLRIAFFPDARVVHLGRGSSTRGRGELAPRALAGRLRYFRKHHGTSAVLAVRIIMTLGMGLRLLAMPARALLRPKTARADLAWYWGLFRAALLGSKVPGTTNEHG